MGMVSAPRPGGRAVARGASPPYGRVRQRGGAGTREGLRGQGGRGVRARADAPTFGNTALQPAPDLGTVARPKPDRMHLPKPARLRVAPPLPVMVPRVPFIGLVLVLVVGGVLGILLLNTKINENSFRLHDLRQGQAELDQRQQELEERLAGYESPNNLAAAACKLGLVSVGAPAFLRMPDGRVIGSLQPATGEPCVTGQQSSAQQSGAQQSGGQRSSGTGR